jgi:AcrR family transcriptional regulator
MTFDTYKKPLQSRAIVTEQRFLDGLHELLEEKSLGQITVEEIADKAQLTRGAFLKRFGSKKQALLILYDRYCDKVYAGMAEITLNLPQHTHAADVCYSMSKQAEALQMLDFPANRAMHEVFQEQLTIDRRTKEIFMACVDLMRKIQALFLPQTGASDTGAFAAAQLLFTLDYNFVLKSMPGFPRDPEVRHRLIGRLVAHTLEI